MSTAAKQVLLKSLEMELGNTLTLTQMNEVLQIINGELGHFEVEHAVEESAGDIDLFEAFISAKEVEGRSHKTIARYRYVMNRMLADTRVPLSKINVYHLRGYLSKEKVRGIGDSTLEGYREIFSSVFGWLYKEGLIQSNPCNNLSAIKCAKRIRLPYSDTDIEKLKEQCTCIRDKALICFLRASGCRISEVCALNRDDFDPTALECTVIGKGDKERTVYFDDVTAMLVQRYLDSRVDDNPALFVGIKNKERITPGGVRWILNKLGARAEVENVHPHRFRRTLATDLIGAGMPIQNVADILGHDKLDTTMAYIYRSKNEVKNSYQKYA